MNLAQQQNLMEIFRQNAAAKRREIRLVELAERAFEDRKREEKREKAERERVEEFIMASAQQVSAFRDRLDGYDTAVVHALMGNERALDEVRQRREAMEVSAYQLPDGRKAFKTEDGARVFDQHGEEVPRDVADPQSIPDTSPRWEAWKGIVDTEHKLQEDRHKLHDFQHRLDDARDRLGKGPISADEMAEMEADLQHNMPDAVKARLPGAVADSDGPDAEKVPTPGVYKPAPYLSRGVSGP